MLAPRFEDRSFKRYLPRRAQEPAFDHERHQEVAVTVVVEQHGDLVAVVALHGPLAPAIVGHAGPNRERLGAGLGRWEAQVVVARATRAGVVLPEVREQERAPAPRVLGIPAHHLEPRSLDLALALALRPRSGERGGDIHRSGP